MRFSKIQFHFQEPVICYSLSPILIFAAVNSQHQPFPFRVKTTCAQCPIPTLYIGLSCKNPTLRTCDCKHPKVTHANIHLGHGPFPLKKRQNYYSHSILCQFAAKSHIFYAQEYIFKCLSCSRKDCGTIHWQLYFKIERKESNYESGVFMSYVFLLLQ